MAKMLFICLGNICRSPAAEAVMNHLMQQQGITGHTCDSAGTSNFHEGQLADRRMREAAAARGIKITHHSRPVREADFKDFDYLFVMDQSNARDLQRFTAYKDNAHKVQLMANYCQQHLASKIPDPYYGGPSGFDQVLDLLTDAATEILHRLTAGKL